MARAVYAFQSLNKKTAIGKRREAMSKVCFVKRWCAVLPWTAVRVTGQLFTGLPSAGFVWFWLFCYCMRAWVLR